MGKAGWGLAAEPLQKGPGVTGAGAIVVLAAPALGIPRPLAGAGRWHRPGGRVRVGAIAGYPTLSSRCRDEPPCSGPCHPLLRCPGQKPGGTAAQ